MRLMLPLATTFYDIVLFGHILAVVIALGPTFAYPAFVFAARAHGGRAMPAVAEGIRIWDQRVVAPGLLVILATAIYLVIDSPRWEFFTFFVSWGFLAVIVLGGIGGAYLAPRTRKLIELAEADIARTPRDEPVKWSSEFERISVEVSRAGVGVGAIVLFTVYFMTAKPFL